MDFSYVDCYLACNRNPVCVAFGMVDSSCCMCNTDSNDGVTVSDDNVDEMKVWLDYLERVPEAPGEIILATSQRYCDSLRNYVTTLL